MWLSPCTLISPSKIIWRFLSKWSSKDLIEAEPKELWSRFFQHSADPLQHPYTLVPHLKQAPRDEDCHMCLRLRQREEKDRQQALAKLPKPEAPFKKYERSLADWTPVKIHHGLKLCCHLHFKKPYLCEELCKNTNRQLRLGKMETGPLGSPVASHYNLQQDLLLTVRDRVRSLISWWL